MATKHPGDHRIKFVVWDLGDTLIRIRPSVWCEAASWFQNKLGVQINYEDVHKAVRQEWLRRNDPVNLNIIRNIDTKEKEEEYYKEFYTCVGQQLGLKKPSKKLLDFLVRIQIGPHSYEVIPGAIETLEAIRERQISQVLLSNGFVSSKMQLVSLGLDKYFDLAMISYKEKLVKPDIAIYQRLLQRMGMCSPDNVLFIDDRLSFVEGADKAGMQAVWFNHNNGENYEWRNTVSRLDQILDRVERASGECDKFLHMMHSKKDACQRNRERVLKWEIAKMQ